MAQGQALYSSTTAQDDSWSAFRITWCRLHSAEARAHPSTIAQDDTLRFFEVHKILHSFQQPIPTFAVMQTAQTSKHEIIRCERCSAPFECKANKFTQCQCSAVAMTINEVQYVSELYDGCLCASCLRLLRQEYAETIG